MTNFFARYSQELSVAFVICLAFAALSSLLWTLVRKRKGLRISPWQIALCAALLMAFAAVIIISVLMGSNVPPTPPTPSPIA